jgi:hypothetical protein
MGCSAHEGSAKEWCVFGVLSKTELPGTQIFEICHQLSLPTRDRCLELTQRVSEPATSEACDQIMDQEVQQSCYLYAADNLAGTGALEHGFAVCAHTGSNVSYCYYHLIQGSIERWMAGGGLAEMEGDVRALIEHIPQPDLGLTRVVGRAAVDLGAQPNNDNPCRVFGEHREHVIECQSFLMEYYSAGSERRQKMRDGSQLSWPR